MPQQIGEMSRTMTTCAYSVRIATNAFRIERLGSDTNRCRRSGRGRPPGRQGRYCRKGIIATRPTFTPLRPSRFPYADSEFCEGGETAPPALRDSGRPSKVTPPRPLCGSARPVHRKRPHHLSLWVEAGEKRATIGRQLPGDTNEPRQLSHRKNANGQSDKRTRSPRKPAQQRTTANCRPHF